MKVSIIIPCFNEATTIAAVLDRVRAVEMPCGADKEIVVIDDGSSDGSARVLRDYQRTSGALLLHESLVNFGKGAAVRYGLAIAGGDVIVIQDADLELRPEEIPSLVEPILRGEAQVVYGSRFLRRGRRPWTASYAANRFLSWLTRVLYRARLTDMETCYKAFARRVIEPMRLESVGFEIEPELTAKFLRFGHVIHERPISYEPRTVQQGKKIRPRDGLWAVLTLLRFRLMSVERMRRRAPAPMHSAFVGIPHASI